MMLADPTVARSTAQLKAARKSMDHKSAAHWGAVLDSLLTTKAQAVNAAIDSATVRPIPEGVALARTLGQQPTTSTASPSKQKRCIAGTDCRGPNPESVTSPRPAGDEERHDCRKPQLPSKARLQRPVSAPVARTAPPSLEPTATEAEGQAEPYRFPTKLVSTTQLNQRCFRRPTTAGMLVVGSVTTPDTTTRGSHHHRNGEEAQDRLFTFDTLHSFHAPIYSSFAADGVFRPDVRPSPPPPSAPQRPQSAPQHRQQPAAASRRDADALSPTRPVPSMYQCIAANVTTPKFVSMEREEGKRAAVKALMLQGLAPKPRPQSNHTNLSLLSAKRSVLNLRSTKSLTSSDVAVEDGATTEVDSLAGGTPLTTSLAALRDGPIGGSIESGHPSPRAGTGAASAKGGSEASRALRPRKPVASLCVGQILNAYHAATRPSSQQQRSPRSSWDPAQPTSATCNAARAPPICSADMALRAAGYRL